MHTLRRIRHVGWLILLLALAGQPACKRNWERFISDEQGRALMLHGLNVSNSAKDDPQNLPWVDAQDVSRLALDWGFNFARYLIFWSAIEPEETPAPGAPYDDAYLDAVHAQLDWFADAGIYVVLDLHQDVYAKFDAEGELFGFDGAPGWAVRTDGIPHTRIQPWFANYLMPAVIRAFDNFFDYEEPHRDLQDRYAAAVAYAVQRLKDHPAVLGYDIMNEPFPGSVFSAGNKEADAQVWDQNKLKPFYDRVIAAIRAVDSDGWIFYEPRAFGPNSGTPSYLGTIDDPRNGESRLAYFPHYYSSLVDLLGVYDPESDTSVSDWAEVRAAEIEGANLPMLIGEFGGSSDVTNLLGYVRAGVEMAEKLASGWAYWSYDEGGGFSVLNADGSEKPVMTELVRTYPQRIAGQPISYDFDPDTRHFELYFDEKPGVTGATEIFVPADRLYPNGFDVDVSDPDGTWSSSWDATRQILSIETNPARSLHAIHIRPTP